METKPTRPNYQPYVPVHRRRQVEATKEQPTKPQQQSEGTTEVKRRGRGQFRAPPSTTTYDEEPYYEKTCEKAYNEKTLDEKASIKKVDSIPTIDLANELELKLQIDAKQVLNQDWESLFDDEDEDEDEEPIKKPVTKLVTKPVIQVDEKALEELSTVLDCYDFPNTFKSHHLQGVFREYEKMRGGYQLKWMDDTRVLVIFDHPATAKKAYIDLLNSSIVKVRPYKGQLEIKPTGPVPRRPVTTDMVAKRLVHGALGVRTVKTPEQRTAEKELLQAAREQRELNRLENQKRQKEIASAFDE